MATKKKDAVELQRQIKEMEDAARTKAMANASTTAKMSGEVQPDVSFDQWWMMINHKVKMLPHLKEILAADFKARGLSKKETEQKYDAALRLFGYKW